MAIEKAHERNREVAAQMDEVKRAIAQGSASGPAGSCEAPAVPAHATLFEVFQHAIEAQLSACEVEDKVKLEMRELAQRDLVVLLSRMATMANAAASTRPVGAPSQAQPRPGAMSDTASVLQAPPVMPAGAATVGNAVGDARIQPRVSPKEGDRLPAQALASLSQGVKAAHAETQRLEKREAVYAAARAQEAMDAAVFEEEQAAAARLQEATGIAAVEGLS